MPHSKNCSQSSEKCLLCSLEQFLALLSTSNSLEEVNFRMKSLLECIYTNLPLFTKGSQEDAHELLISLINTFRTEPAYNSLFLGQLCCQIRCQDCGITSRKLESFSVLSVDIQHAGSLHTSLHTHFHEEYLYGTNAYFCSQCKQPSSLAVKSVHIHSPPEVLFIHLKRFVYEERQSKKLTHYVDYPRQLDVSAFIDKVSLAFDPL